ncbi:unnamed protein product [Heterosigma akashiwo]
MLAISTITMLMFNGKLLGLSGIAEGLLFYDKTDFKWKAAFTASFMAMAQIVAKVWPSLLDQLNLGSPWYIMTFGGFLVGYGTRLGNGCTSGHGICGLARLSSRSIAAVVTFLTAAIATARTLHGMPGAHISADSWDQPSVTAFYAASGGLLALFALATVGPGEAHRPARLLCTAAAAALFAAGLCVAGMGRRAKILNFLVLRREGWDYSLLFILGFAVVICFIAFRLILSSLDRPLLCNLRVELEKNSVMTDEDVNTNMPLSPSSSVKQVVTKASRSTHVSLGSFDGCTFGIPKNTALDLPLILGAWLFGIGWGLCGICPGPAMLLVAAGYPKVSLMYLPALYVGMAAARATKTLLVPKVFAAPKEDEQRQQQAPAAAAAAAQRGGGGGAPRQKDDCAPPPTTAKISLKHANNSSSTPN